MSNRSVDFYNEDIVLSPASRPLSLQSLLINKALDVVYTLLKILDIMLKRCFRTFFRMVLEKRRMVILREETDKKGGRFVVTALTGVSCSC